MRVIAGSAGGLQLKVPRNGVRPTMDRVKAAIFSSLGDRIAGARVLDLFAGSGGLGIEALSRGAQSALFIERNRTSADAIMRNLEIAKLTGAVRVQDVFEFLKKANDKYDVVFADPPYEKSDGGEAFTELLLFNTRLPPLLEPAGLFVLEKRPDETLPKSPLWEVERAKSYGATEVLFLSPVHPGSSNPATS